MPLGVDGTTGPQAVGLLDVRGRAFGMFPKALPPGLGSSGVLCGSKSKVSGVSSSMICGKRPCVTNGSCSTKAIPLRPRPVLSVSTNLRKSYVKSLFWGDSLDCLRGGGSSSGSFGLGRRSFTGVERLHDRASSASALCGFSYGGGRSRFPYEWHLDCHQKESSIEQPKASQISLTRSASKLFPLLLASRRTWRRIMSASRSLEPLGRWFLLATGPGGFSGGGPGGVGVGPLFCSPATPRFTITTDRSLQDGTPLLFRLTLLDRSFVRRSESGGTRRFPVDRMSAMTPPFGSASRGRDRPVWELAPAMLGGGRSTSPERSPFTEPLRSPPRGA